MLHYIWVFTVCQSTHFWGFHYTFRVKQPFLVNSKIAIILGKVCNYICCKIFSFFHSSKQMTYILGVSLRHFFLSIHNMLAPISLHPNNTGANQPAHLHSLISVFLDSINYIIIAKLVTCTISIIYLVQIHVAK